MEKPSFYNLKWWIKQNRIVGLNIHTRVSSVDGKEWAEWEFLPSTGTPVSVNGNIAKRVVHLEPDHNSVLRLKGHHDREIVRFFEQCELERKREEQSEEVKSPSPRTPSCGSFAGPFFCGFTAGGAIFLLLLQAWSVYNG